MGLGIQTGLGITTKFYNFQYGKLENAAKRAVDELTIRHPKNGQFLKWVELPKEQINRVDEIYKKVAKLKEQSQTEHLSVIGIGGSKHPIEHMLSINGLNLDNKIKFLSDIDETSYMRYLNSIGGNLENSNFLIVSKSGTTFEPKDALHRIKNKLHSNYSDKTYPNTNAEEMTAKHFIAVTDKNPATSELRQISNKENWLGDLYIHDDVGGRFSAFDDHTLFTLAYAGMSKNDMIKMLESANAMSQLALTKNLDINAPLAQAAFWVAAKLGRIKTSVHQYMGSMFENTVNWHAQMQNESIKNTLKQITKVPDAMHHSAEAHFNPRNKFAFALTSPEATGEIGKNVNGYVNALNTTYAAVGPHFNEIVSVLKYGLTPEAAGALTQSRAFSTVYQELITKLNYKRPRLPKVLQSVLQPYVETYKKNLKPQDGKSVVIPGLASKDLYI